MRVKFSSSIMFKTALLIVILELIALFLLGVISTTRFRNEAESRIINQIQLPGKLMARGVLDMQSISDKKVMYELIGEEMISGMVIGINGRVYYALDIEQLGKKVTEMNEIDLSLFSIENPEEIIRFTGYYVESSTPIFAADGITPHFFVYIKSDTTEFTIEMKQYITWFSMISLILVIITSGTIFTLFYCMIIRRITISVGVLQTAEGGNLTARIENIHPDDEIAALQEAVNKLIANRQSSERELKKLLEQQRAINGLILAIGYTYENAELYQRLYEYVNDYFNSTGFSVYLLNERGKTLSHQFSTKDVGTLNFDENISDSSEISLLSKILSEKKEIQTGKYIYIPMEIRQQIIGIIKFELEKKEPIKKEDLTLLLGMSNIAAVAINNANLFKKAQSTIEEKELLLKEFFHRTKNNLQVVASMLSLKMADNQQQSSKSIFQDVENRILAMAMIHEKLYQSNNLSTLPLDDYIRDLVDLIKSSYYDREKNIRVELELSRLNVLIDLASPLGLVLNEILANAYKHAFTEQKEGLIKINLTCNEEDRFYLEIEDNGKGFPENKKLEEISNFGLTAINDLNELPRRKQRGINFLNPDSFDLHKSFHILLRLFLDSVYIFLLLLYSHITLLYLHNIHLSTRLLPTIVLSGFSDAF